jgi:hypothetical protein
MREQFPVKISGVVNFLIAVTIGGTERVGWQRFGNTGQYRRGFDRAVVSVPTHSSLAVIRKLTLLVGFEANS